jgi:hypothetical protein
MSLGELLFGRPLRSDAEAGERIGPARGIPVLGLDALASASYGPEAALTILLAACAAVSREIVPVSVAITVLLLIVYFPIGRLSRPIQTAARSPWQRRTSGRTPASWPQRRSRSITS